MSVSLGPEVTTLLSNVTTSAGKGTSRAVNLQGRDTVVVYVIGSGTITGGSLTLEEAYQPGDGPVFAGTWSAIGSAFTAITVTANAQSAIHLPIGAYSHVRVRLTADITGGGNITVVLKVQ